MHEVLQLTNDKLSRRLNNVASLLVLTSPTFWVGVAADGSVGEQLLCLTISQGDLVVRIGAGECLKFCEDILCQVFFVAFCTEFVLSPLTLRVQVTDEFLVEANLVFFIHSDYFSLRVFN